MKKIITILLTLIVTQSFSQIKLKIGAKANYYFPTNTQKGNILPFTFLNSAKAAGLDLVLISKKSKVGLKLSSEYISGTNDKDAPMIYAKNNDIQYTRYSFSQNKAEGIEITAGPRFALFPKIKRLPLIWLELEGGILLNNNQSLNFYNKTEVPVKEFKPNNKSFVFHPKVSMVVFKTSKIMTKLNLGYSTATGFGLGIGISAIDCNGWPCYRCNFPWCTN